MASPAFPSVSGADKQRSQFLRRLTRALAECGFSLPSIVTDLFGSRSVFDDRLGVIRIPGADRAGDVDLFELWCAVTDAGGMERVQARGQWDAIANYIGFQSSPQFPAHLSEVYYEVLLPLEEYMRQPQQNAPPPRAYCQQQHSASEIRNSEMVYPAFKGTSTPAQDNRGAPGHSNVLNRAAGSRRNTIATLSQPNMELPKRSQGRTWQDCPIHSPAPRYINANAPVGFVSLQLGDHHGPSTSTTLRKQVPARLERRQAKNVTRRRRGLGADHEHLSQETSLTPMGRDSPSLGVTVGAAARPTTQVIGHTMPLDTVIQHLVNQGCADVSSHLKNIDEHSKYSGSLSDVYQGRWRDGSLVAVKCLRAMSNSDIPPGKTLKHTARELYTWSRASHPNILKLHGLALIRGKLAMIAPWMKYSSLLVYIRAWPQADRCRLCVQIAAGLSYMHNLGLAHGDVKGNNVVVSEAGNAKITDFGSTMMANEFAITFIATQSANYSIRWAAPELFQSQSPGFESDVYAFAKTVLEALTGDVPHKGLSDFAIMRQVGLEGRLPDRPLEVIPPKSRKGDRLWNMLTRCWDMEPARRPSINRVFELMNGVFQEDLEVLY